MEKLHRLKLHPSLDTDARKMASEISAQSWRRRWNARKDSKGRHAYELFIPAVGTKIIWPKKRDTAISYCRILLHDTMLNNDSYREQELRILPCVIAM